MSNLVSLSDLAERDVLQKILDNFNSATDLTAIIVDLEGNPIGQNEISLESCPFCNIIRANPEAKKRCAETYATAGKMAAAIGEPYIFRCPAGLIEWSAPLFLKGKHLGTIICGQVLMWKPEDFFWIELAMMNKEFQIDMPQLITAAQELPVVSGQKVQAAADLLFFIANHLINITVVSMDQQKTIEKQNLLLKEETSLREIMELSAEPGDFLEDDPELLVYLKTEKELISHIKAGEKERAMAVFKKVIARLFAQNKENLPEIKSRSIELLGVISRAVMDRGNCLYQVAVLNRKYVQKINALESEGQIISSLYLILEHYLSLTENPQSKNSQIVQQAGAFMKKNFRQDLKLEQIAQAVFLSPYYLSHVFKEETGVTVMEYLTKTRMEEAKRLLKDRRENIKDVAKKVGYHSPGYFSKLFRNIEGLTPSQYRMTR